MGFFRAFGWILVVKCSLRGPPLGGPPRGSPSENILPQRYSRKKKSALKSPRLGFFSASPQYDAPGANLWRVEPFAASDG